MSDRCSRIFVLLGLPAAPTLDIERNGTSADSILALARAASTEVI
jgi:hypothetical protein